MPLEFRVKLVKIGNSLRLTLPKPAAEGLKWKEGEEITLTVTDHEVVLTKSKEKK